MYHFVEITKVKELSKEKLIDVARVVHEVTSVMTVAVKNTNEKTDMRHVTLVDRSGASIRVTLWGKDTKLVDNLDHPVIYVIPT